MRGRKLEARRCRQASAGRLRSRRRSPRPAGGSRAASALAVAGTGVDHLESTGMNFALKRGRPCYNPRTSRQVAKGNWIII